MMRFGDSKSFNLDKQFVSKDDASQYVAIMKRSNQDKFVKYNLFKRLELWLQINEQLITYDELLSTNITVLDSVIQEKEDQWTLIWWWGDKPDWLRASRKSEKEEPQDQEPSTDQ